ncbi:unnamed protein product, partial [Symbiodinium natans]
MLASSGAELRGRICRALRLNLASFFAFRVAHDGPMILSFQARQLLAMMTRHPQSLELWRRIAPLERHCERVAEMCTVAQSTFPVQAPAEWRELFGFDVLEYGWLRELFEMQWAEATFQALSFLIPSLRKRFGDFGAINVDVDSSLFSSQAPCAKLAKSSREKLGLGRVSWRQAHGRDWLRHRLAVLEHCLRREFRNLTQDFGVDAASRIFHFRNAQEGGAWAELLHLARLDTHDRVMLQSSGAHWILSRTKPTGVPAGRDARAPAWAIGHLCMGAHAAGTARA